MCITDKVSKGLHVLDGLVVELVVLGPVQNSLYLLVISAVCRILPEQRDVAVEVGDGFN